LGLKFEAAQPGARRYEMAAIATITQENAIALLFFRQTGQSL
jgi:hypothetical protein